MGRLLAPRPTPTTTRVLTRLVADDLAEPTAIVAHTRWLAQGAEHGVLDRIGCFVRSDYGARQRYQGAMVIAKRCRESWGLFGHLPDPMPPLRSLVAANSVRLFTVRVDRRTSQQYRAV